MFSLATVMQKFIDMDSSRKLKEGDQIICIRSGVRKRIGVLFDIVEVSSVDDIKDNRINRKTVRALLKRGDVFVKVNLD